MTSTKKKLNYILSSGLSLIILKSMLFINPYHEFDRVGYGLCNTGCKNEKHFSKINDYDKIQNNNEKFTLLDLVIIFIDVESNFFELLNNKQRKLSRSFNLYSRPPPKSSC